MKITLNYDDILLVPQFDEDRINDYDKLRFNLYILNGLDSECLSSDHKNLSIYTIPSLTTLNVDGRLMKGSMYSKRKAIKRALIRDNIMSIDPTTLIYDECSLTHEQFKRLDKTFIKLTPANSRDNLQYLLRNLDLDSIINNKFLDSEDVMPMTSFGDKPISKIDACNLLIKADPKTKLDILNNRFYTYGEQIFNPDYRILISDSIIYATPLLDVKLSNGQTLKQFLLKLHGDTSSLTEDEYNTFLSDYLQNEQELNVILQKHGIDEIPYLK